MRFPLLYIGISLLCSSCARRTPQLQTGDLLFQVGAASAMSQAITDATGRTGRLDFTHVGILLHGAQADSVLEATGEGGVRIVPLQNFLDASARTGSLTCIDASARTGSSTGTDASFRPDVSPRTGSISRTDPSPLPGGRPVVVAMRLKDTAGIAASVARARKALGASYDYSFLPDNGRYYCSELVYDHYRRPDGTRIFPARPMNFRAADGTLPRYWQELFERRGEAVPEGVPGTNPNDMAREPILREVCDWSR